MNILDTKNIQKHSKNNLKSKQYFDYKKLIIFIIWAVIFLILVFFCINYILEINFVNLEKHFKVSKQIIKFIILICFGLLIVGWSNFYFRIWVLKIKLKRQLQAVTKRKWFSFLCISFFIQTITPFSIGSEPYAIWWLKKQGISVKNAMVAVSLNSFTWFVAQFIVTWPSFIYFTVVNFSKITDNTIPTVYWLTLVGLFVDLIVGLFIFFISYSSSFHYFCASIYHKILQYLKLKSLFKEQLKIKYLVQNSFKKKYLKSLFQIGTIKIILLHCLHIILSYFFFVMCYFFIFSNNHSFYDYFNVFNIINIALTANNFVPVPSGEISVQWVIQSFLLNSNILKNVATQSRNLITTSSTNVTTNKEKISTVIFFWRLLNHYFWFFIAQAYIIFETLKYFFKYNNFLINRFNIFKSCN